MYICIFILDFERFLQQVSYKMNSYNVRNKKSKDIDICVCACVADVNQALVLNKKVWWWGPV